MRSMPSPYQKDPFIGGISFPSADAPNSLYMDALERHRGKKFGSIFINDNAASKGDFSSSRLGEILRRAQQAHKRS